jgi:hypothetical protein
LYAIQFEFLSVIDIVIFWMCYDMACLSRYLQLQDLLKTYFTYFAKVGAFSSSYSYADFKWAMKRQDLKVMLMRNYCVQYVAVY